MEMITAGFIAAVFAAGLLSFFTPCVLPLLPVYLGYLSGDSVKDNAQEKVSLLKAFAFVFGISASLFILGLGAGALGGLINSNWFFLSCGAIIVLFGLYQTGLVSIPLLNRERKLDVKFNPGKGIAGAFALGFLFSFGWTPCVGPVLGAVLGLSSQQGGVLTGGGLLLIYALGLSLPFAVLALSSRYLLLRIKSIYPHLAKIKVGGGVLIIMMGAWMVWGQVKNIQAGQGEYIQYADQAQSGISSDAYSIKMSGLNVSQASLGDLRGKVVYVKFWATWCPLCLAGLEDFSSLTEYYADVPDTAIISIVTPGLNGEVNRENFTAWARAQNLTFPIYFDESGALTREFGIKAYPTSVYLAKDGRLVKQAIGDESNERIKQELSGIDAGRGDL